MRRSTDRYLELLDSGERARLHRFKFDADKERFLLGHGFLREMLGAYLGRDAHSITFERGTHGKPYLTGHPLHFNLSDTKDAIAVAFARHTAVGLDVETMHRTVDHVSVGAHYFTKEEQASIEAAYDGKRRFLEFWTRKEAVLKASGVGIMDDLRVLRVDQTENRMMIAHETFIAMAAPEYHVTTWAVDPTGIISLATPLPHTGVKLFALG
ncbi:MAG: 4'-phosphopantetheinyl transferase superfamily protein [Flavobacteriales bacterium]|nr:4'-phosphopantetheinyl transferase superfamily protein [Flavobacteriales bacterium]